MEISMRKGREGFFSVVHVLKMLIVAMSMLSMVLGINSFFESSESIKYKKRIVEEMLLQYFNVESVSSTTLRLKPIYYFSRILNRSIKENYTYIGLTGDLIRRRALNYRMWPNPMDIERSLTKADIGGIKCKSFYIDSILPFKLVKMLIDQMVVEEKLHVNGFAWQPESCDTLLNKEKMVYVHQSMLSKINWHTPQPLELLIDYCRENVVGYIFQWVGTRTVKKLSVKGSDMEVLDLREVKITKKCHIAITSHKDLEHIELPKIEEKEYAYIKLHRLPKLKGISGNSIHESTALVVNELWIDRNTFIALAKSYKAERADHPVRKGFHAKNVHLDYMPHTFEEMAGMSYIWLQAEKMILHIEYCDLCSISKETVLMEEDVLGRLRSAGIACLGAPVYKDLDKRDKLDKKPKWSRQFIRKVGCIKQQIDLDVFKCSQSSTNHSALLSLQIYLKNSDMLQAAIRKFQERYDQVSIHTHYEIISIYGDTDTNSDLNLLMDIFSCMGLQIKISALYFSNIKKFVQENAQKHTKLSIAASKITLILNSLYFYSLEAAPIIDMLSMWAYPPGCKIFIDCQTIKNQEDWVGIGQKLDQGFSEIVLRNASMAVKILCELYDSLAQGVRRNITLELENPEYFIKMSDVADCLKSGGSILSSSLLSALVEDKDAKNLPKFLVYKSVGAACEALEQFTQKIGSVIDLKILICNSGTSSTTTVKELSCLIEALMQVFVDVKIIRIFSLRIKEEEVRSLFKLRYYIDISYKHPLSHIYLRGYKTNDREQLKILNYMVGENKLNWLLKKSLREKSVLVDRRAIPFIQEHTYDRKLDPWEKDLIEEKKCVSCKDEFETKTTSAIYIMKQCKHWMCIDCVTKHKIHYHNNTCPICNIQIVLSEDLYYLCLKSSIAKKETPMEDDFNFKIDNCQIYNQFRREHKSE
ncbi:hypothetical protein NEFER03_1944 [Nematocida sp. LUAm3]|nr:hypothetical protein NEFER03_1944 [Nematocida sp. LUAm3]KAI5176154.1 hypothetical protein NEFER02_1968 [Nematocida sp. LUAm2]KAI5179350.1 hypothetical protein NEFER01_2191 [Nematocida sp. LUAm1]